MNWNIRRRISIFTFFFLGFLCVLSFQNCNQNNLKALNEIAAGSSQPSSAPADDLPNSDNPLNNNNTNNNSDGSTTHTNSNLTILDFESGDFFGWRTELASTDHTAQFVSSPEPVRKGTTAVRFELRRDDPDVSGSRRAELARSGAEQNGEYWYAFSVYLPSDYAYDRSSESLAQWKGMADIQLGESGFSPSISLATSEGKWKIYRLWDDQPVSTIASIQAKGQRYTHELGVYESDKGRWTDWVFHIKWGWSIQQDPKLEVYKNGVLVLNQNGLPNTTNDVLAPYFKMGIYKWDWKEDPRRSDITTRVIYFDRVLFGSGSVVPSVFTY